MASPNSIKVSQLQAPHLTYDYITFSSETFLDLSISNEDERINIDGYSLQRANDPNNKNGRFLYVLWRTSSYCKQRQLMYLKKCLVTEIIVSKKKCLYRLPTQTKEEFEEFCIDLNFLFSNINNLNILLSVITGDFNARPST